MWNVRAENASRNARQYIQFLLHVTIFQQRNDRPRRTEGITQRTRDHRHLRENSSPFNPIKVVGFQFPLNGPAFVITSTKRYFVV